MRTLLVALPAVLFACAEPLEGEILAIGDSAMAWNAEEGASIPDVVGEVLGVEVANAAVSGSMVLGGEDAIPDQYVEGTWRWLVMTGGGNDLNDECGCGDCAGIMDELIAEDGDSGAIPDFVGRVVADGVRVAYLSYYDLPEGAEFGFDDCDDELDLMRERLALLAEAEPELVLVDGRDAFSAEELEYYDEDLVHPSIEGARALGELLAEAIDAAG